MLAEKQYDNSIFAPWNRRNGRCGLRLDSRVMIAFFVEHLDNISLHLSVTLDIFLSSAVSSPNAYHDATSSTTKKDALLQRGCAWTSSALSRQRHFCKPWYRAKTLNIYISSTVQGLNSSSQLLFFVHFLLEAQVVYSTADEPRPERDELTFHCNDLKRRLQNAEEEISLAWIQRTVLAERVKTFQMEI